MCLRCAVGSRPPAGVRLPPQQQQQPTMLRPTVPCASVCYAGLQGCATYRAGCCCSAIAALSWPEHGAADAFTTSTTTESFHYQPVQIHTCILIQNRTCHLAPRCYSGFLNTFCRMLLVTTCYNESSQTSSTWSAIHNITQHLLTLSTIHGNTNISTASGAVQIQ